MLKIIIPLAGSSEIFHKAGFPYPKPLIEMKGNPMIEWVIEKTNSITIPNQVVFVIKDEDATKYHLDNTLKLLSPNCEIIKIKNTTKGGLCSVLMTIDKIDNDDSILILNSDQIIEKDLLEINSYWLKKKSDVGVVTFKSVHP